MALRMKSVLLYDGRCGFCKIWIRYWRQLTGDRIEYVTSQEAGERYPQISPKSFAESVQLVRPDGSFASGARAVFETLGMEKIYESSSMLASLSEASYRFIANHRNFFYQATRFTFGTQIEPARFEVTQWIFLRLLAIIYAIAFASLGVQITGLIGASGILPVQEYLNVATETFGTMRYMNVPTVFWFSGSDSFLRVVCWAGVVFSVVLFLGKLTRWMLILAFLLYLSLSSAGQVFLSFQWDALLLEAGFLAIFLGRAHTVIWLFRWLVFRLYFLSGAVKLLSHDPAWWNLTALEFHFHTQPLPVRLAWYADKLPGGLEHGATFLVLAIEVAAPFLIFSPRRIRHAGASLMIALQVMIFLTGNYAFFNLLTLALCVFLFEDRDFHWIPVRLRARTGRPNRVAVVVLAVVILTLGISRMIETFEGEFPGPLDALYRVTAPFGFVNSYGLFAVMTTTRPEIIVEGSNDGQNWLPYEFRYKPGDPSRPPRWAAPHQPRLDWQMWFAALGDYRSNPWFVAFAARLLEGSPPVLALLEKNPFPDKPPRYIRATVYEYSFTHWRIRQVTGQWWKRERLGVYLSPISLRSATE